MNGYWDSTVIFPTLNTLIRHVPARIAPCNLSRIAACFKHSVQMQNEEYPQEPICIQKEISKGLSLMKIKKKLRDSNFFLQVKNSVVHIIHRFHLHHFESYYRFFNPFLKMLILFSFFYINELLDRLQKRKKNSQKQQREKHGQLRTDDFIFSIQKITAVYS